MDLYYEFSKDNRTLSTKRGRSYAGQRCDARSTTLHFDLYHYAMDEGDKPTYTEEWDFDAECYSAYIMFRVYDENGYPYYYGDSSSPKFDGYTFQVPYEITTRARSARVEFQLVFTKVPFDGTLQDIDATEYLLSAVSGFAVKDEGERPPMPPCGPRACAPPSPVACEPSVGGWIEMWKDVSVLLPIDLRGRLNEPGLEMTFTTYRGQSQTLVLNVPTLNSEGQVSADVLPTGDDKGQFGDGDIPLLKEIIGDGEVLQFDSKKKGFVGTPVVTKADQLKDEMNADAVVLASAVPFELALRNSDGQSYVLQLRDRFGKVASELDLPIEDVVNDAYYKDGKIHLIINTPGIDPGTKDVSFSVTDLLPLYEPGDDYIAIYEDRTGSDGKTVYSVEVTQKLWDKVDSKDEDVKTVLRSELSRETGNREAADKALDTRVKTLETSVGDTTTAAINTAIAKERQERQENDARLRDDVDSNTGRIVSLESEHDVLREEVNSKQPKLVTDPDGTIEIDSNNIIRAKYAVDDKLSDTSSKPVENRAIKAALDGKQQKLRSSSTVTVNDDGTLTAAKQIVVDAEISSGSSNPVQSSAIYKALQSKQDVISVDSEFLTFVNNKVSLNLDELVDEAFSATSERPVQNKVISKALDELKTLKAAIPKWAENGVEYKSGDIVEYLGSLYICIADSPLSDHQPPTNVECWSALVHSGAAAVQAVNRPVYITQFGNDTATEYTIRHNLMCRELVWSMYTADSEHVYVNATVSAPTINTLRIRLSEPPGVNGLVISIMRVREAQGASTLNGPMNIGVSTPSKTWTFEGNDTGMPLFVQVVSVNEGVTTDIVGDIIQNSAELYNPVTVGFQEARSGTMILAPATACFDLDGTTLTLDKKTTSGLKDGTWYLVQCFKDGEGESVLDVAQDEHTVTVSTGSSGEKWQGLVCLYEATLTQEFSGTASFRYQHNQNRYVGAQSYNAADGLMGADYNYSGLNIVEADFHKEESGILLIL